MTLTKKLKDHLIRRSGLYLAVPLTAIGIYCLNYSLSPISENKNPCIIEREIQNRGDAINVGIVNLMFAGGCLYVDNKIKNIKD